MRSRYGANGSRLKFKNQITWVYDGRIYREPQDKSLREQFKIKFGKVGGIRFASKKEALHYLDLLFLEKADQLRDLELQPKFALVVNNKKICSYVADFQYVDCESGKTIVVDTKGHKTPEYKIKSKLFRALYPELEHLEP